MLSQMRTMSKFSLPVLDSKVPATTSANTLAFVDAAVDLCPTLIAEVTGDGNAIVLEPTKDGVVQITATLARYRNLDKLHIVSLGSPEGLYLGNSVLSPNTLHGYIHPLMNWTDSLKPNAAIFLYRCNHYSCHVFSRLGIELASKLSHLTGVSVAVA